VSAFAIEASVAYIFLRAEYTRAAKLLTRAIAEAYAEGCLGKNIQGSGFDLELHLHASAGRYICGEETAGGETSPTDGSTTAGHPRRHIGFEAPALRRDRFPESGGSRSRAPPERARRM
jgi:NADH:ubiquinone oxidoreductase subunit F (NADH-binding)